MPSPVQLSKAKVFEIEWSDTRQVRVLGEIATVQFNPETLKVSFTNQRAGGDQPGNSSVQFVGRGTTKLAVELVFDVTAPEQPGASGERSNDVRRLTQKMAYFMIPQAQGENFVQRGVRFIWGSFLFEGVMDSMNETLELFSADGRPLRATVAVEMSQQEIKDYQFNDTGGGPGAQPSTPVGAGQSVQDVAASEGRAEAWRDYASGIENPRRPPPGTRVPSLRGRG